MMDNSKKKIIMINVLVLLVIEIIAVSMMFIFTKEKNASSFESRGAYVEKDATSTATTGDIVLYDTSYVEVGRYTSIERACRNAKTGYTVKLLKDVNATERIELGDGITIDLNGHTFSSSAEPHDYPSIYRNGIFEIYKGSTIKIISSATNRGTIKWSGTGKQLNVLECFHSGGNINAYLENINIGNENITAIENYRNIVTLRLTKMGQTILLVV